MTGESFRPRQVWLGPKGVVLPVFVDNTRVIGQGRGRKVVSDCVQWLRLARQPFAILTNGKQFRLLFAGLDFEAGCEWDVDLWFEEGQPGPQLEALRRLLQPALFEPANRGEETPLLLAVHVSRRGQSDLSSTLGERVREAVELLVRAHGPVLDARAMDATGADIYRAAVRVVMRMVVVLFAESRDLLPRSNPIYHDAYGLPGLFGALQRLSARGRGRLDHRFGAWPRVLALFRLICDGSHHEALMIPHYGGDLFMSGDGASRDPMIRALSVFESGCFTPGLEVMPDTVVFKMLELLTRTQVRVRQGRQSIWTMVPVDFSDLSSEYIGILYEGLLDYELRTAPQDEPIVFLSVGDEPALPLSRLEQMDDRQIKDLFETLKENKNADAEEGEDAEAAEVVEEALEDTAEAGEEESGEIVDVESEEPETGDFETARRRAIAWTRHACLVAGLVTKPRGKMTPEKELQFERLIDAKARQLLRRVVLPGEWFLVRWGGTRKGAGTFYTRPQLAVPTVHRTLRPLAYNPPVGADGQADCTAPAQRWLPKPPEDILSLKVCDPGCGSGSFLVASVRFLTEAVYASLHTHNRLQSEWQQRPLDELLGLRVDREADLDAMRLPCRPEDDDFDVRTKAILRRYVVERCLYGVDLDPLAIELCKLALWIETMDRDLPFSFLDHKIKCGNSLVGAWFDQFQHYPVMAYKNREGGDKSHTNGVHDEKEARSKAIKAFVKDQLTPDMLDMLRGQYRIGEVAYEDPATVHDKALGTLARLHDMPVQDAGEKARIYREELLQSEAYVQLKDAMDMWCACWFWPAEDLCPAPLPTRFGQPGDVTKSISQEIAMTKRFFHWELEFPDVFWEQNSGFDAIVGNPPWDIAKPNSKEFFSNIDPLYRSYGKQEALRKQTEYFHNRDIEGSWLAYNADFRAQSNFVKYAAFPFGDPKFAESSSDRFALARGKDNDELHDIYRRKRINASNYSDANHSFRHQGAADINLYKLFLEQAHTLLAQSGRMGFVVPSGLYSDNGTGGLRELFLSKCRWEWLFGFENREKIFDIDSRFKFNAVIVEKGGTTVQIQTAFMRRKLEDWERAEQFATGYDRSRVEQFSPKSKAILEIQSARDLEILEKIYANSVLLGDDGPDGWGISYAREFDMTNDSKLFPPRPQWEAKGYKPDEYSRWLLGTWRPRTPDCPAPLNAKRVEIPEGIILSRDQTEWIAEDEIEDVALPFYQGVMIGIHNWCAKSFQKGAGNQAKWVDLPSSDRVLIPQFLVNRQDFVCSDRFLRVIFRDISNATNERTFVASVIPPFPTGNKTPLLRIRGVNPRMDLSLLANLGSIPFDWTVRCRMTGTSLNYFIVAELPVLKPGLIDEKIVDF